MCKYCKLDDHELDAYNSLDPVNMIVDGCQVFSMYLDRYVDKTDNHRRSELVLELGVKTKDNNVYVVKTKHKKIKYCPFCGEKL